MTGTFLFRHRMMAVTALILTLALLLSAPLAASEPARRFISEAADAAIAAMVEPGLSEAEREQRVRSLLNQHFAVEDIARFVLGRHWPRATEAERQEYLRLFEDIIVFAYMDRFDRFTGESMTVGAVTPTGVPGEVVVQTEFTQPRGTRPVQVGWRLRETDGSFEVIDVVVENVSMSQTQRSEFASVVRRSGGRIQGLLAEMRTLRETFRSS
ncbi:MAG: ABC transporter substrate-binding protein [Rhodospirillales bacterium]|nr:MAG: ABC transporter substrate-binding protein [Rhodospirillales bacterium]